MGVQVMLTNMETNTNYLGSIKEALETEANEILKLKDRLDSGVNDIINMILYCDKKIIFTGMGKSGLIGRKIAATFASTGTPSFFLHPAEALHGDLGKITKDDIVMAISNSGETEEIMKILPSIRRIGAKIIGIVGSKTSTLASRSDFIIDIGDIEEACPLGLAPTSTTTVTLALGDALAVALLKARDFKPENFALFHPGGSLGRRLLLTVNHIAKRKKVNPTTDAHADVKDVLFKMTESGLGAVTVVDEKGQVCGILTDGDIRRELSKGNQVLDKKITDIYTKNPIVIHTNHLATEALRIMEDHNFDVLPVVQKDNKPIALIHIQDLTKLGL